MDVWLIQDGERCGPFPSFEIERLIRDGEIDPDTPSWIEGQGEWQPLSEARQFADAYENTTPEAGTVEVAAGVKVPPVVVPELPVMAVTKAQMLRRFWARWFDLHLYGLVWLGSMRLAGHNMTELVTDMWMLIWQMLPWFGIEAVMIHLWGTTPGKALLGIRVRQANGRPPAVGASVWRSLRVWVLGLGLGMPLLVIFCQGVSFWVTRRVGRPLWDAAGDHRVSVAQLLPARVAAFVGLFVLLVAMRGWVLP